jgi:hypothetical protein
VKNSNLSLLFDYYCTELVETLHAIETGNLIKGSTTRVFDCCPQPIDAFECIKKLNGICRNNDYPNILGACEPDECTPFTTVCICVRSKSKIRLGQTGIKVSSDTFDSHYRSDFCDKFTNIEGDEQKLIDYE